MILNILNLTLALFLISCSMPDLQNPGDINSLSGKLTKLLLDVNSENARLAYTNQVGSNADASATPSSSSDSDTSAQTNTNSSVSNPVNYGLTIRVNNLAGASSTASAQFSLNGGIAETVSTTGNAVRDLMFSTRIAAGDPYLVTVTSHPNVGFRVCNIPSSAGAMPANDLIVMVYCYGTTPSAGSSLTVNDVVGASSQQSFFLDGDPGTTVFMNVNVSSIAYAFDAGLTSTATLLVFNSSNYGSVQNITVYRAQTGVSAQMNVTHGLTPFTQLSSVNVTP